MLVPGAGGTIMTDADGWTLYTWGGDAEGVSNCADACLSAWPAFAIDAELISPDGLSGSLGFIDRADGTWQVTLDNWPLYYFSGDTAPGAVNGDGSMGFGARWYVTAFAAAPVVAEPVAPVIAAPAPMPVPAPAVALPPVVAPPVVAVQPVAPIQTRSSVPIRIVDFNFGPPVNLQVGDTVIWTNTGSSAHTATSDHGLWDSGRLAPGQTYSFTFNTPGNYSYHDAIGSGMSGLITVGVDNASYNQYSNDPFFNSQYNNDPYYNGQYNNGVYNGGQYGQGPGFNSPGYPGYDQGFLPAGGYAQTLNVVAPPNGIVTVSWLATPNVLSYRIYETLTSAPLNFTVVQTVNQTAGMLATNATLAGLTPGASYLIQVRAVGFTGLETVAPAASTGLPGYANGYLPLGPLAPTALSVSSVSPLTTTLAWAGSTGATSYRVSQSLSAAGPFAPSAVGATTATGTTVTGLSPTTTYFFQVVALDGMGNQSPPSNTATWTTTSAMAAPTSLNVSGMTATTVTSNWVAVPSATSYRVSQSQSASGPFTASSTMNVTATGATVTGLSPSTAYYFQVSALDATGNTSLASNTAMGLTTPTP